MVLAISSSSTWNHCLINAIPDAPQSVMSMVTRSCSVLHTNSGDCSKPGNSLQICGLDNLDVDLGPMGNSLKPINQQERTILLNWQMKQKICHLIHYRKGQAL